MIELTESDGLQIPREEWPEFVAVGAAPYRFRVMVEDAMALMLAADVLILLSADGVVCVHVLCNDVFAYACGDSEPVPYPAGGAYRAPDPFWQLYDLVRVHGSWGAIAWVAERRQTMPLPHYAERLREMGLLPAGLGNGS